jgi:hypothetical protein
MRLTPILSVTALVEGPTGLLLLVWPALVFAVLFGWHLPAPETLVMGRVAGACVLSIGIASWVARGDARTPAQLGVLAGVLTYNVLCAAVLVFAGAVLSMAGIVLWPAVVYHVALAAWSLAGSRGVRAAACP